jgi:hypothetical protein
MPCDRAQSRLRRDEALIEILEPLSPPSELDRPKRRLRRASDDVAHCGIYLEKRLERGPQVGGEQPQHLRAIAADRRR